MIYQFNFYFWQFYFVSNDKRLHHTIIKSWCDTDDTIKKCPLDNIMSCVCCLNFIDFKTLRITDYKKLNQKSAFMLKNLNPQSNLTVKTFNQNKTRSLKSIFVYTKQIELSRIWRNCVISSCSQWSYLDLITKQKGRTPIFLFRDQIWKRTMWRSEWFLLLPVALK